jgi:HAMP domain-containing protein
VSIAGSSPPGGRSRLSESLLRLTPSALRWWAGGFCAFLGSFVIVAPQEFSVGVYRALHLQPLAWGVMFVLVGGILLTAAALRPRRGVLFVAHALAAGAFAYLGGSFAGVGGWTGAVVYSILAAGLFATGLLPEVPPPSADRRRGDALSLLLGLAAFGLGGVLIILAPTLPPDIYGAGPRSHRLLGALLLLVGPLLVAVHLRPGVRRSLTWLAHAAAALGLIAAVAVLSLPSRTWSGVALYGSAGLTLALLPWLRRRLRDVDPASLGTRLALTFGGITSIGLLLVVAILQSGSQREAENVAAEAQREEALSVARNVVDYIELVAARSDALAAAAGREPWVPARQRELIVAAAAEKPRIASIGVYALDGTPVAEVGRRPIERLSVLRLVREGELAAGGEPPGGTVDGALVRMWPQAAEPLLLAASPVPGPLGRPRGLVVTAYDARAVLWRLSRSGLSVRLLDDTGRELAAQRRSRTMPGGERRLEAMAPVPVLGWQVVVERPLSLTLASVRRERLLAFGLLLAAVLASVGAGVVAARVIAAPLRRLAAAADQLAAGNPDVPLGGSGVSELDRLSAHFRDMRDSLEARTGERERLAEELRERADALTEADRRKDEFLAMLAHELRNPLGAMSNAAYLLGQRSGGTGDPHRRPTSVAMIRPADAATSPAWSTTCWTSAGSPAARWSSAGSRSSSGRSWRGRSRPSGRSSTGRRASSR